MFENGVPQSKVETIQMINNRVMKEGLAENVFQFKFWMNL